MVRAVLLILGERVLQAYFIGTGWVLVSKSRVDLSWDVTCNWCV